MNSFLGNTLTSSANNTLRSVNSTISSVNSAMESTVTSAFGAVNSIGESTLTAMNNIGTTTLGALTPFTNSDIFSNVNSSQNNVSSTNSNRRNNNFNFNNTNRNFTTNASSNSGGWGTLFGMFLFLIAIFLVGMIVFRDQITAGWNYFITSIQSALNMNPSPMQSPDQTAANREAELSSPMPTTLDATYEANKEDTKNIVNSVLPLGGRKEVFNVSSNEYSYYDAEPLCRALGSELATYDQVKTAWSKGADWCNYGWTKGQVAIYPTQQATWDKLQGGPPDEHTACGQPGVNGGYFDDPEMKFGVNCFGVKPPQDSNDERLLMENGTIPKTVSTLKIDQQINDIKNNLDMVGVLPFNSQGWSAS